MASNTAALKRINKELKAMRKSPTPNITASPVDGGVDLFHWHAQIQGPAGSPYEGGAWKLDIRFPHEYPFTAPSIKFLTPIYHCNIRRDAGSICLDTLSSAWNPLLSLTKALQSICLLLEEPNPSDPLEGAIASLLVRDKAAHDAQARKMTKQYAMVGKEGQREEEEKKGEEKEKGDY